MATFKGFAMKKLNETGWVEKEVPECGPLDAIVRPTCVSLLVLQIYIQYGKELSEIEKTWS
ncbi:putative NADP-dependent alcohol dehydrogenase [Methanobrevibacter smithii ATCC 35061]|jgi:hypothetical protein|uniref:Putative NADP-dependent alcohol dehydrogenase n=1 Tax=Methanobrevibacter smithii (strain ATCC 35061 / DSM 861 / OCM 144 / PS) TaxID=420247 RepID=A5UN08_METS3|nr:putative NADP-dependent alcohol dehydrogenase [Methanobrevibacter smithii ATCC 35061]